MLGRILLVGCGGFLGSVLRYLVNVGADRIVPNTVWPLATIFVNLVGCFFIGYLGGLASERFAVGSGASLFIIVGILGGFTTFSTYAYESLVLTQQGLPIKALGNLLIQVVLGFSAAWLGLQLGR